MTLPEVENEAETIQYVQSKFQSKLKPFGIDAYAQPSIPAAFAVVIGGLWWTALMEARNAIAIRVDSESARGIHLDDYARRPPLNLLRYGPTQAEGEVSVDFPIGTVVLVGTTFTSLTGVEYTATEEVEIITGEETIPVISSESGSDQNSPDGQHLTADDGDAVSLGIFGGYDEETDEQFRQRIYAAEQRCIFAGSACSYVDQIKGIQGVTRAWAVRDGFTAKILFLMEDKYPCGEPTQDDIDEISEYFQDECLVTFGGCVIFEGACVKTITLDITWETEPEDLCAVRDAVQDWLRDNYGLDEGVRACEIQGFLSSAYPNERPYIEGCPDYEAECGCVYNCVEVVGCVE